MLVQKLTTKKTIEETLTEHAVNELLKLQANEDFDAFELALKKTLGRLRSRFPEAETERMREQIRIAVMRKVGIILVSKNDLEHVVG